MKATYAALLACLMAGWSGCGVDCDKAVAHIYECNQKKGDTDGLTSQQHKQDCEVGEREDYYSCWEDAEDDSGVADCSAGLVKCDPLR